MRAPEGLSLHNVLSGRVSALHTDPGLDHVIVQVAVGRLLLLAEVTQDAIDRLKIAVGAPVYALVKSVSIDVADLRALTHSPPSVQNTQNRIVLRAPRAPGYS